MPFLGTLFLYKFGKRKKIYYICAENIIIMITLNQFRDNANIKGICEDKARVWDNCGNKKELMDLALSAQGLDYVANAVGQGWGISADVIRNKFGSFNNGRYVFQSRSGYKTAMYCGFKGRIIGDLTAYLIIDSDIEIDIASYCICELYVAGKCNITLLGSGRCRVKVYGDHNNVTVVNKGVVDYRRDNRNDFDR